MGDGPTPAANVPGEQTEETMRKSLILPLIAIGGGASYAAGVTEVATGPIRGDPSTWRWQVTSILSEQSDIAARPVQTVGVLDADVFNQRYERYTPLGMPEVRGNSR
jgi:hypothetical protein